MLFQRSSAIAFDAPLQKINKLYKIK